MPGAISTIGGFNGDGNKERREDMYKWSRYIIAIAIVIFAICIIADIFWIGEEPSTKIEIEAEVIKEPVGRMEGGK